jgi:hypothetical protein
MFVQIHNEQHSVLNGLKDYGFFGIDDLSKVRHFLEGIKTTELYPFNTQMMTSPSLLDDYASTFMFIPPSLRKRQLKIVNSMFLRLVLLAGRGGGTRLASVVPLELQMFQTLQRMTFPLRRMHTMLSHLIRRIG